MWYTENMKREKKKNTIIRILAFLLAALMVLGVVVSAVLGASAEEAEDEYGLSLYYHEDSQAFEVSQTLRYTNRTGHTLSCVRFHLYANAYRRATTAPFLDGEMDDAYPDGFVPGGLEFVSVRVDGQEAEWGVSGEGEEFLRVDCPMEPGDTRQFQFDYYALLPACRGRIGAGALDARLGCFYPVAAVWNEELGDFGTAPLYALGDSLFSQWAKYRVEIDVPAPYVVAAPGEIAETPLEGNRKRVSIEVEARQFAMTMSRRYSVYTGGDAQVYAVDAPGARRALEAAKKVMAVYEAWLGPCPGARIAQADISARGLGYPGLILIRSDLFALGNRRELEWEIARQMARQYFAGLVGVDPVEQPFLNDSLSEYAALVYFESQGGYEEYLKRLNQVCLSALQTTLPGMLTVDAGLYAFQTEMEYDAVIRGRGCAVLHEMRQVMGEDKLRAGLARYVEMYREKTASLEDFALALEAATGRSWRELLVSLMRDIGQYAGQEIERYE